MNTDQIDPKLAQNREAWRNVVMAIDPGSNCTPERDNIGRGKQRCATNCDWLDIGAVSGCQAI